MQAERQHPNRVAWMAASCCGASLQQVRLFHKIDCIMRKETYVDILKQRLKTSARKLKLHKWVFKVDNDPKQTYKTVIKWVKDIKVIISVRAVGFRL